MLTVNDLMTDVPHTITIDTPLRNVIGLMKTGSYHHLPVLEMGKLVGIITDTDIFKVLVEISGVYEGGAQACLQLSTEAGSMAPVINFLNENGARIMSIMTRNVPESEGTKDVYIRIRDMEKTKFKRLQEAMSNNFTVQYWAIDAVHTVL